jgi:stearoyl-CoA desaturase (Delta-9 desaturase)
VVTRLVRTPTGLDTHGGDAGTLAKGRASPVGRGLKGTMSPTLTRAADEKINWVSSLPFLLFHAVPLLAFLTGVTWRAMAIFVVLYAVRMFAVTAGYHRYFSHRSYRVSRPVQGALAFLGTTAVQKGPLWWASHHRSHHRYSDTDDDIHSPQKGFWWSHVGWILCDRYSATDLDRVRDLAAFPELRFIERYNAVGPWALGVAAFLVGGWSGLVVGFFGSTVLLWHATFTINSLNHTFGTRRYATTDTSRNNLLLALLTFGEGWHNNHHHYRASARQGFFWWEIDVSWYALRTLAAVGLVHDLRRPTREVMARDRVRDGAFDLGMFRAAWRRAGAAVSRSGSSLGAPVSAAANAVTASQAALQASIHAKRIALDEAVAASLRAAEELTRTATLGARGLST